MPNPHLTRTIPVRLLLLEDSANDAELEVALLENAGYACTWDRVQTRDDFLARLHAAPYDCIISDFRLPDFNGLAALRLVRREGLLTPFILVSGTLGEDEGLESLKAGATDYVLKSRFQRLVPAVQRALTEGAEARRLRETEAARAEEADISAALVRVAQEVIASLDTPVLLRQLCQLTAELLQCDCSHAFLLQPDGRVDAVMAGHGHETQDGDGLPIDLFAAAAMEPLLARLKGVDVIELPAGDLDLGFLPPRLECTLSGVGLYVTLRRAAGVVGVLSASRRDAAPFTPAQYRKALGIAQLASLALVNARVVQEIEELSRLKSDFVNVMSHELRTPLNIIMGYDDLLREGALGPLNADQLGALERSRRASHQLLDLVNTVLDVGLLDAGTVSVDVDTLDLRDLLAEIESDTEAARGDKPLLLLHVKVWPAVASLQIDRAKLKVVLRKVVDNAIEFTDKGTVTVDAHPQDDGVEITVSDTGIGITADVLAVMFQPFRQGERALTRRHGGIGLGLHVVRRLLDALGGRITVVSAPGQGSTFKIWVPAATVAPAQNLPGRAA